MWRGAELLYGENVLFLWQIKAAVAIVRNTRGLPPPEDFQRHQPFVDLFEFLHYAFGFQVLCQETLYQYYRGLLIRYGNQVFRFIFYHRVEMLPTKENIWSYYSVTPLYANLRNSLHNQRCCYYYSPLFCRNDSIPSIFWNWKIILYSCIPVWWWGSRCIDEEIFQKLHKLVQVSWEKK